MATQTAVRCRFPDQLSPDRYLHTAASDWNSAGLPPKVRWNALKMRRDGRHDLNYDRMISSKSQTRGLKVAPPDCWQRCCKSARGRLSAQLVTGVRPFSPSVRADTSAGRSRRSRHGALWELLPESTARKNHHGSCVQCIRRLWSRQWRRESLKKLVKFSTKGRHEKICKIYLYILHILYGKCGIWKVILLYSTFSYMRIERVF